MPTAACENSPATTDVAFPTHRTSLRPWRSALPYQGNRRPPGAMTQAPPPATGTIEKLPNTRVSILYPRPDQLVTRLGSYTRVTFSFADLVIPASPDASEGAAIMDVECQAAKRQNIAHLNVSSRPKKRRKAAFTSVSRWVW